MTNPPFSLVGIDHVVFIVDDLGKAVKWYADVLGCQPGYSYPALGMEQVWGGAALASASAAVAAAHPAAPATHRGGRHAACRLGLPIPAARARDARQLPLEIGAATSGARHRLTGAHECLEIAATGAALVSMNWHRPSGADSDPALIASRAGGGKAGDEGGCDIRSGTGNPRRSARRPKRR